MLNDPKLEAFLEALHTRRPPVTDGPSGLRVLKVRKEAPLLVLELAVHALLLTPGRASMLSIERMLLAGIDAPYDPTQQHQYSDLTLQIVYKGKVVRGDGSQAVDERIITRRAEARTQTEAR